MADVGLWAGALVATAGAAGALVLRDPRQRALAASLALVLVPVLIAADNWDDERLRDLRDSPALLVAAGAVGAALLAGLATLFRRFPYLFAILAFAALPFRVPVEAGGDSANLLLPLYAVIAAGVLAELAAAFGRPGTSPAEAAPPPHGGFPAWATRWLPVALGAFVVLYAVQGIYSNDFSRALINTGFFLVPFAVLASLLVRVEWTPRLLRLVLAVVVGEAIVFALIGFAEYGLRELLWNDAIIEANEVHFYFRVNSLFWDPNIFGRYLALTLVAVVAVTLWARTPRSAAAAAGLAFGLLAALAVTFSQSSLIALLAGLAVLAALRWSARWVALACVACLAAIAIAAAAAGGDLDIETSGRGDLIRGGLELAENRPIAGHGSGSFERKFERRFRSGPEPAQAVSHTEPVTIAAEQGAIGLLAYLAVLAIALAALAAGIGAVAPGLRAGGSGRAGDPVLTVARVAVLAGLVAIVVHSLSYAAFFTDPITWALAAVGLALARRA